MSLRSDGARVVLDSIGNAACDRRVELFRTARGTFGFDELRRDHSRPSSWVKVAQTTMEYASEETALSAAIDAVPWLAIAIAARGRPTAGHAPASR